MGLVVGPRTAQLLRYAAHPLFASRLQALDLSYSPAFLRGASFSDLKCLQSLDLTGCGFERDVLRSLPPSLSTLILDGCKCFLLADDTMLAEVC